MDPKDELKALEAKTSAIVAGVKASGRTLSEQEITDLEKDRDRMAELKGIIANQARSAALLEELTPEVSEVKGGSPSDREEKKGADSLGEHFVKSGTPAEWAKGQGQRTVSAGEFKAATDVNMVAGNGKVQYGGLVENRFRRLTIADLLGKGSMSATTLTYFVQGATEGDAATVAENGLKPSVHFNFSPVTEALSKIAVITKISDEAMSDTDYLVSVINSQLVARVQIVEEDQLLNGNGTAPNLRGLLQRSGIQTYATTAGYTAAKGFDAIFHAITMVATGSALASADGIVINPADYEVLRLAKNNDGNYMAGGPFSGGNPGLWGVNTVVTPAIAAGTVLVGAFGTEAQLFRKGGISVDATNSNEDDFKYNRVALRAEERVLLAVYRPAAFVKLTLTA